MTLKLALDPAVTVWFVGCVKIEGAVPAGGNPSSSMTRGPSNPRPAVYCTNSARKYWAVTAGMLVRISRALLALRNAYGWLSCGLTYRVRSKFVAVGPDLALRVNCANSRS